MLAARADAVAVGIWVVAALVLVFALQYAQAFLIPIVLAILISYALDPIVQALARLRIPRAIAAALVVLSLAAAVAATGYTLRDQAAAIVDQVPEAAQKLRQRALRRGASTTIDKVQQAATEIERTATEAAGLSPAPPKGVTRVQVEKPAFNAREYLVWGSLGIAALGWQLVLLLFLLFFLLASGDMYKRKLVKIGGDSLQQKRITLAILDDINRQIARYLLVLVFTGLVVGLVSYAAFRWLGLAQPGVWAIAAGVFNSIPYLGPVVISGGVFVVATLQFGTIGHAMAIAGVAMTITTLEGWLLTPWLSSRAARMNAVAVFIGLLFWSWVWGVWGLLLAVPMLMVVKAICDRIEDLKPIGELLGE